MQRWGKVSGKPRVYCSGVIPPASPVVRKLKQNHLKSEEAAATVPSTPDNLPNRPLPTRRRTRNHRNVFHLAHHPLWRRNTVLQFRPALSNHVQLHQYLEEIQNRKCMPLSHVICTKENFIWREIMFSEKRLCNVWIIFSRRRAWENFRRVCVWGMRVGRGGGTHSTAQGLWTCPATSDLTSPAQTRWPLKGERCSGTKPVKTVVPGHWPCCGSLCCSGTASSSRCGFRNQITASWWAPISRK